jgi:hypothetical protein
MCEASRTGTHARDVGDAENVAYNLCCGNTDSGIVDRVIGMGITRDAYHLRATQLNPVPHKYIKASLRKIEKGWRTLADNLHKVGHLGLSRDVQQFIEGMPPPRTEKELVAARCLKRTRAREHNISRLRTLE